MTRDEITQAESEIRAGRKRALVMIAIAMACAVFCFLPIGAPWKVLPFAVAFSAVLCGGPLSLLALGRCECGHPACLVDRYNYREGAKR